MKLLNTNPVQGNAKLDKALSVAGLNQYRTASLSMMPTRTICPGSTMAGCFDSCLKSAGRGQMQSVVKARQNKTDFWNADKDAFISQLVDELKRFESLCNKTGKIGAVRLNVLSDIQWEKYIDLESFKLQFYDYSKVVKRFFKPMPYNYNLTFSYSEANKVYTDHADKIINETPHNVAVVFNGSMPIQFKGRKVISGDKHDLRFLDESSVIVGLSAKGKAKQDTSGFVIQC